MQISASEHLRKICRQHADAIDDENLEFMRMFAYTGDSISDRGHPFAAQCLSVLRGCDGKEVNGMAMDEELYRQYLCGDEAGLVALMKKYGNPLTLYINGYLHDVHEAEDLMIEVFSYLFTKKPRIRDGGLKAYLYKAARHMALRGRSRRRLFFSLDNLTEEPDGQTLVEVVRTKERDRILHFCMAALNPDYREALYLVYFEGMSYLQAAEVMGKSEKQITNMVYQGQEVVCADYWNGRESQMRSHEERIAEVKRRIAEKERQRRQQQERIAAVFGVAACLAVIVGVSLFMPDMVNRMEPSISSGFGTAATMLGGSAALGYIVTGLLAFVLGVCVTIACFRICLLHKDEQAEEQRGDNTNGTCR